MARGATVDYGEVPRFKEVKNEKGEVTETKDLWTPLGIQANEEKVEVKKEEDGQPTKVAFRMAIYPNLETHQKALQYFGGNSDNLVKYLQAALRSDARAAARAEASAELAGPDNSIKQIAKRLVDTNKTYGDGKLTMEVATEKAKDILGIV